MTGLQPLHRLQDPGGLFGPRLYVFFERELVVDDDAEGSGGNSSS